MMMMMYVDDEFVDAVRNEIDGEGYNGNVDTYLMYLDIDLEKAFSTKSVEDITFLNKVKYTVLEYLI